MNPIKTVTILGFGEMGRQIASLFYTLGYHVHIFSKSSPNQSSTIKRPIKLFQRKLNLKKKGQITFFDNLSEIPNSIVIETISENLIDKTNLYNKIHKLPIKEYCTNSSSYKPSDIGESVLGFHFFNPIYIIPIIEMGIPSNFEMSQDFKDLIDDLKFVNFEVINVTNTRGYYGNLLIFSHISTMFNLIEEHEASIHDIDRMYKAVYNQSIIKTIDIIGIDLCQTIMNNLAEEFNYLKPPKSLQNAIKQGILGKKNNTSICNLF
jgi:3-hydroxyacyl-CoA dehydrogenase